MGYLLAGLAGGGKAASEIADKYIDEAFEQRRQENLERIANARYDKQRGDQLSDKAADRETYLGDKASDRQTYLGDKASDRQLQVDDRDQARTLGLEDEARKIKNEKEMFKWEIDNTPKEAKDSWMDIVDKDGNVTNQRNIKTGALKWSAKDRGGADGKAGKDNIIDLPIDLGSDVKIKYNETTGEFLDPTGVLSKPRGTDEDVSDIVDARISDINRVNGSDAEFAEYYQGVTDSVGNSIKTEDQARRYETEQALAGTNYAAQYGIPANKIVKQWASTDQSSQGQQATSQNSSSTMKIGNVTVPVAMPSQEATTSETAKPSGESNKSGGMLTQAEAAGQPAGEPQSSGQTEEDQRSADIALLEANGVDTSTPKEGKGYFELTAEDGTYYNPAVEATKSTINMMEDNRPLNLAIKAGSNIKDHFASLDEASQRRATETSKRAVDKLKAGKPLNKLEIKAIKEVPQSTTENQELVAAWLRFKNQ